MGIPVLPRKADVEKYPDAIYVISSMIYGSKIEKELKKLYINKNPGYHIPI